MDIVGKENLPCSVQTASKRLSGESDGAVDHNESVSVHSVGNEPFDVASPCEGEGSSELPQGNTQPVSVCVVWGKHKYSFEVNLDQTVQHLKCMIQKSSGVPPAMQKLMFKGLMKDTCTLGECKVTNNAKIMLIGCTVNDVVEANTQPKPEALKQEEEASNSKDPLCKQRPHDKVIEKGVPEDAMPGIKNAKDALPPHPLSGMVNKAGGKVRLTFKLEVDELWIGTKERTDKIPMNQIRAVVSEPITGHEQYHIMGVQLGPTEASRYWIYWVPAQYIDAIRAAIGL